MDEKTRILKNSVNGEHADAAEGQSYALVNPATGQAFARSS